MTTIMLSVADGLMVEISPLCRILQNSPDIRYHLSDFDLMTEVDQISECLCSVVLERECMFCFCVHIFVQATLRRNLHRNMHSPSSSLTSAPSASPNSLCTFPRLYLRKGQVAHTAMLCYFLNNRRVQQPTNGNVITQYITNSNRPILYYTYLFQYVIYICFPWVISPICTCLKLSLVLIFYFLYIYLEAFVYYVITKNNTLNIRLEGKLNEKFLM
jgi:hypothetical protein